jgi:hypothetical protein
VEERGGTSDARARPNHDLRLTHPPHKKIKTQISAALLPRWDETALRIKASRLLGSQSLARYPGWKGDRAAVDAEAARNRAAGEAAGCWKGGVLVDDGSGRVAAAFAALDAEEAAVKAAGSGGS